MKNKIPSKDFRGEDMLFNKKKISNDVISMSSASSVSSSSSSSSLSSIKKNNNKNRHDDNDTSSTVSSNEKTVETDSDIISESDKSDNSDKSDDYDNIEEDIEELEEPENNKYNKYKKHKEYSITNEINEKKELLYQMKRLEEKGYKLPFNFDMNSDINDIRNEYNKIIRDREVDASIRFQRKILMSFVTGTEYLNTRYDPFSVKLDGWSEQVNDTLTDYDDIFEELHAKYKSTGKKMSPELRLFISLSGSAFMFHLTNRMFKESSIPNVEEVLKSNPDLMKQFQNAAAKQYIMGNGNNNQHHQQQQNNSGNGGLFGVIGNLFNNISGGSGRQNVRRDDDELSQISFSSDKKKYNKQYRDVDSIINNVHNNISLNQNDDNIETLSISDEEITSIIEDTADIKILRNKRTNKKSINSARTLNI